MKKNASKMDLRKVKKLLNRYLKYRKKQNLCFLFSLIYTINMMGCFYTNNGNKTSQTDFNPEISISTDLLSNDFNNEYNNFLRDKNLEIDKVQSKEVDRIQTEDKENSDSSTITSSLVKYSYNRHVEKRVVEEVVVETPVNEKIDVILGRENLTHEQLNTLFTYFKGNQYFGFNFSSDMEIINHLYNNEKRSYEEKMLIVMVRENLSYKKADEIFATGVGEAVGYGTNYVDAYAVINTLYNRVHYKSYINAHGTNLYNQLIAPGQFGAHINGSYRKFLGKIDLKGYQAGIDMLYSRQSIHEYIEFRGSYAKIKYREQFVTGGNKYLCKMKEANKVDYGEIQDYRLILTK